MAEGAPDEPIPVLRLVMGTLRAGPLDPHQHHRLFFVFVFVSCSSLVSGFSAVASALVLAYLKQCMHYLCFEIILSICIFSMNLSHFLCS